jgi:LacI family transcriptional regulator
MKASPTLKDVAEAVGLSSGAVSLALRDSPKIPAPTRERVREAARRLGYRPNPAASTLAQYRKASTVKPIQASLAWLNTWDRPKDLRSYRQFDCYWQGAEASAALLGYRLEEFIYRDLMPQGRLINILAARGIQGLLLPPGPVPPGWTHGDPGLVNFSIVRIGRSDELPVHCVTASQMENAMLAFEKTREKGYERVGFVAIPGRSRFFTAGYLWSIQLEEPSVPRLPPLLLPDPAPEEKQQRLIADWLDETKPDAIISDFPKMSQMLENAGHRVPDDIGLVSLNTLDTPFDAGIYQNPEEIGRVAILLILSIINDNDRGFPRLPRQILVPGEWVDGTSLPSRCPLLKRQRKLFEKQ